MLLGGVHIPKSISQQQFMQNLGGKQSALWGIGKQRMQRIYYSNHSNFHI